MVILRVNLLEWDITAEFESYLKRLRLEATYTENPVKMRILFNDEPLCEISLFQGIVHQKESKYNSTILEALSICGAIDMSVNIGLEGKNLTDEKWKDWFFNKMINKCIVLDTNFILRHYFSSVILPKFTKEELKRFWVLMPRTVILEIERLGNLKEMEQSRRKTDEDFIMGKEKRLAFYAAKEVHAIRQIVDFGIIPMYDSSSMIDFTNRVGRGFGDAWIRKETHDMVAHSHAGLSAEKVMLITCDLMNSMAAMQKV